MTKHARNRQKSRLARGAYHASACLLLSLLGCNNAPFDIVPVSGDVAYEDGSPIPSDGFKLKFVPQASSPDGKNFPRVATAEVGSDGTFDAATTYKYEDGLVPCEQVVYFQIGGAMNGKSPLVPPEYQSSKTSPLTIDVANNRRLEIRVPKP